MDPENKKTSSYAAKPSDEVKSRKGKPFSLKFYHMTFDLSIEDQKEIGKKIFPEKKCVRCGKIFIPTKPEYKYEDTCSYTCWIHRDDKKEKNGLPLPNQSKKGRVPHPVVQFSKAGEQLGIYPSAQDAANAMGVDANCIRNCCLGINKTSASFVWRYQEDLK